MVSLMAARLLSLNGALLKTVTVNQLLSAAKRFSSNGPLVTVYPNENTGVATISLNNKPVNSMSLKMMEDAIGALDKAEKDMGAPGIILTSSCKGVFGAGLELTEVLNPEQSAFQRFWTALQELSIRLYGSPVPVISAINGHTIAGGMIFALAADHRILAKGKYKLGLNETAIGLPLPKLLQTMFINTVGQKNGERLLKLGTLFNCEQALSYGMVDELCEPDQLIIRAEQEMKKWIQLPASAFSATKLRMRQAAIQELLSSRQEETDFFLEVFTQPKTVDIIQTHLNNLGKKT